MSSATVSRIERVLVAGAGTMGSQIALVCALGGCRVHLYDLDQTVVEKGLAGLRKRLDAQVAKGRRTAEEVDTAMARLSPTREHTILASCPSSGTRRSPASSRTGSSNAVRDEAIDTACRTALGYPMGPFELMDLTGIDIGYHTELARFEETGDPADRPSATVPSTMPTTGDR